MSMPNVSHPHLAHNLLWSFSATLRIPFVACQAAPCSDQSWWRWRARWLVFASSSSLMITFFSVKIDFSRLSSQKWRETTGMMRYTAVSGDDCWEERKWNGIQRWEIFISFIRTVSSNDCYIVCSFWREVYRFNFLFFSNSHFSFVVLRIQLRFIRTNEPVYCVCDHQKDVEKCGTIQEEEKRDDDSIDFLQLSIDKWVSPSFIVRDERAQFISITMLTEDIRIENNLIFMRRAVESRWQLICLRFDSNFNKFSVLIHLCSSSQHPLCRSLSLKSI